MCVHFSIMKLNINLLLFFFSSSSLTQKLAACVQDKDRLYSLSSHSLLKIHSSFNLLTFVCFGK